MGPTAPPQSPKPDFPRFINKEWEDEEVYQIQLEDVGKTIKDNAPYLLNGDLMGDKYGHAIHGYNGHQLLLNIC